MNRRSGFRQKAGNKKNAALCRDAATIKFIFMKPNELRKKLNGVISFPCTPFKKDLSLDLDGLRHNLRSLLKHPVCAIVAPAGTGEIHCLSPAEHLAVVKTMVEEVNGKVDR